MSATLTNGRPQRKQLSDQLDRLDGIIDALADALPEAVRDAVRDGTQAALKQVLVEVLTHPDIVARMQPAPPPPMPTPSRASQFLARCRAKLAEIATQVRDAATETIAFARAAGRGVVSTCRGAVSSVVAKANRVASGLNVAWQLKQAVLIGVGVGVVVATVATMSHSAASILAGAGVGCTATAIQIGLWAPRSFRAFVG